MWAGLPGAKRWYFTETTIYKADGKEKRCGYKTVIEDKNSIKEITNIASSKGEN